MLTKSYFIYFQIVSIFKQRGCLDVSGVPETPLKISEQESYVGKGRLSVLAF